MGTLNLDSGNVDSDVYLSLGLNALGKAAAGTPRALNLIASLLDRCVQKNEMMLETTQIKDAITVFHGLRAPPNTDIPLTSLNVHRLLITSVMVAAKFIDDAFFNNAYYAKVGGISTAELNRLEMKFLFSIDFKLHVNVNTFGRYCSQLEKESAEGLLQIERSIQACRIKENWSNKEDSNTCAPTIAR
ncbi:Cyclin family protein [Euphorbia peplus]|nr:Cyclin family protein [Euphorbia peplus]